MSNRIFLIRVSYLVPVAAESPDAALAYMENHGEAAVEEFDVAMDNNDELFTFERELSSDDMLGRDGEVWGDLIPWDESGNPSTIREQLSFVPPPVNAFAEAPTEA